MKYKSEILEVLHQDAIADFEVGAISESRMREFDEMCLVQEGEKTNKIEEGVRQGYQVYRSMEKVDRLDRRSLGS